MTLRGDPPFIHLDVPQIFIFHYLDYLIVISPSGADRDRMAFRLFVRETIALAMAH